MFDNLPAIFYAFISVFLISLLSLVGIFGIYLREKSLRVMLVHFVSFSAGALLGDAFFHLLPTAAESGFTVQLALYVLLGIVFSFIVETIIQWRHCHLPTSKEHVHPFAFMNLIGDGIHNFIDGLIIGASYLVSIPIGVATTIAVFFHEIPQEMGDFAVMLHGGFSRGQALLFNFATALTSFIGILVVLVLGAYVEGINSFLIPFAAGSFIYIAGSDLIPEVHRVESKTVKAILQLFFFVLGMLLMYGLLFLE